MRYEEEEINIEVDEDVPLTNKKKYGTFEEKKGLLDNGESSDESWKYKVRETIEYDEKSKPKRVNKYYNKLNDFLELLKITDERLKGDGGEKTDLEEERELESRKRCGVQFAIYASFLINVTLLVVKTVALLASGSNSVLASVVDSFLDLLAGSIIFITNYFINKKQIYLYPAGKSRIEPLGIIVFSSLMFMLSFFVVLEGSRTLSDLKNFKLESNWLSIGIIIGTIGIKIFLFIYCKIFSSASSSVEALADDHRNDVLTNGFGLAGFLLGSKLASHFTDYRYKMIDPIFAILLALFIMRNWYMTGKENINLLSGKAAPKEFLNLLTFIVWNHHPKIKYIDTVRAYHLAERYIVEIDIILDENMPLKEAHNIGESLQIKIEELDEVERAFVHLDYEFEHAPEHKKF